MVEINRGLYMDGCEGSLGQCRRLANLVFDIEFKWKLRIRDPQVPNAKNVEDIKALLPGVIDPDTVNPQYAKD